MSNTIALVLIATGPDYHQYIRPLLDSAAKYFPPHTPYLWTDSEEVFVPHQMTHIHMGFPYASLFRYHTFLTKKQELSKFDYIFYCDIDMLFVSPVSTDDILSVSPGIVATTHPGHVRSCGFPERNPQSTAYIPPEANSRYFCGGFNGGRSADFLHMSEVLMGAVDSDRARGITACNNDESHLNHYLYQYPPVKILTPSFCFPDIKTPNEFTHKWERLGLSYQPKLLALEKVRKCRS